MNRNQKNIYIFIYDENRKYHSAVQSADGSYTITKNSEPVPIVHTPSNLLNSPVEFATNQKYFSMQRSITDPLSFIKDGGAILRNAYYNGKGAKEKLYMTAIEWDGTQGIYVLSFAGKFDFGQKLEDPKAGIFTVPLLDDSGWGVLSRKDDVEFSVDCSQSNPKAIRVLIDQFTLVNTYTFQTVQAAITQPNNPDAQIAGQTMPFVLVNEDGDSSGIIVKSQSLSPITYPTFGVINYDALATSPLWHFYTAYAITGAEVFGSIKLQYNLINGAIFGKGFRIAFRRSNGTVTTVCTSPPLIDGQIIEFNFDFLMNLPSGGSSFLVIEFGESYGYITTQITPIVTNVKIRVKTTIQPRVFYALRPLDLAQGIVTKATFGRYGINSDYFTINNKSVIASGDSIRQIPNAKIYSTFANYFKTFDSLFYMALRIVNGALSIEQAIEVYKQGTNIIDLGDCIDLKIKSAIEYFVNSIQVGSPDIDLRHPSGRLEFNTTNSFSLPIDITDNKADIVSNYRLGCYDIIFLILDYIGGSTKDNSGDKSNYVVDITDEQGTAIEDIETFENVTFDDAPLEPFIKTPLSNDIITFDQPVIRGIAPAGSTVNIYADTILDGSTVADINGNWSYNIATPLTHYIPGVETGIHIIQATFTDLAAPNSTITVLIDTSFVTPDQILYPRVADNLYNNKPLIKGLAQNGTNIDISLDGVLIATVVADNSCKWSYQMPVIPNGAHTISINAGSATVDFNVDTAVAYPLITYVGSELDGFPVINNLPLIMGVALPGTVVSLWLNYIQYMVLGTVIADANGNWSYQVVPVTYPDPVSGLPIVLAPIPNGVNVISTSLINHTVGIVVTGYKLNRPPYDSITGVIDNTVFNTRFSPKRMLRNRNPLWSAILEKQPLEKIYYETSKKNGNLRTVLGSEVVAENTDISVSSLGNPLMRLETVIVKTKTQQSFAKTLYDFNAGGTIKTTFRGQDIFMLPIGHMKMSNIKADNQEWELLLSPLTSYMTLLNLYRNGLIINLMTNSIFHSDYNSLHIVRYNYQLQDKFSFKTIYDDWFMNRNDAWAVNPTYIQKFKKVDVIRDQVITNGITSMTLKMCRCKDGIEVHTYAYNPVSPAPIPIPEIVLETPDIDLDDYPPDQYFFLMMVGDLIVGISERIETRTTWIIGKQRTLLIEAFKSVNDVGFFYSTGIRTILRVEGLLKKIQPDISTNIAEEESGDKELVYSLMTKKRVVRFGTARGLPDYLYLKIAAALCLDNLLVEGSSYTLNPDEKITPSDDIEGLPMYYYNVLLDIKENSKGVVLPGQYGADVSGVILVVDAEAFGLPVGSLINIELPNE